jgi:hypothetical protein
VEDPVTGEALDDTPFDASGGDVDIAPREQVCEQCGSRMAANDIFCGECGFVSRSVTSAFSTAAYTGETRSLSLEDLLPPAEDEPHEESDEHPAVEPEPEPEPLPEPEPEPLPEPEPEPEPAPEVVTAEEQSLPRLRENPFAPSAPIRRFDPVSDFEEEDLDATRIVSRLAGNRFVLQFSTGESVTVHGSGLIGRNPQPEPGEYFDHLVRIFDSGKSVSKTHLEFGQEGGAFWIKDRFSGNGTVIKEPEISARRAEADRRYKVVRGTRIDIGEQFFVVS